MTLGSQAATLTTTPTPGFVVEDKGDEKVSRSDGDEEDEEEETTHY